MTTWLNVKNNAESTLASAITAAATTLTLAAGDGAKFPLTNFNISIDAEILTCSSRSGDVLTVSRAQEGTAAAPHAAGAIVALNVTAAVITQLQTAVDAGGAGTGDMLKSVYDIDNDGVVDNAEKLEGSTKLQVQDHAPKAHASTHQDGGTDEINVAGLSGLLADGQTPLAHKSTHQDGGADELSLAGLDGELADRQKSKCGDSTLGWTADKLLKGAGAGNPPVEIDVPGGSGSTTFLGLTDTPSSYVGQSGKAVQVKTTEDGLEFVTPGGAGTGDMLKSVYDTDNDGVVDNAEKLEGSTKLQVQDHAPKAHASSHQDGGVDEINVAGLSGELADPQKSNFLKLSDTPDSYVGQSGKAIQVKTTEDGLEFVTPGGAGTGDMLKSVYDTDNDGVVDNAEKLEGSTKLQVQDHAPKAHASTHQDAGADKINVAGLSGLLADGQTPLAHKSSHQDGGVDEINVAGLSGELADPQKSNFLKLSDTPDSYVGQSGKAIQVKTTEDGLEFVTPGGAGEGDMLKSVYDTDNDGVVDNAEKLEGSTKLQVQDHAPKAHATTHQDGGADEINVAGLSGLLADGQTPLAHKSTHQDGGADELSLAGLDGEPSTLTTHKDLTTGVHGAGANHLALFGQAGKIVTKFTPKAVATELWRRDDANNSSFEALINGTPTSTSVVYDTASRENSLPDPAGFPQWGKVILHNITRGNSRKITNVNLSTKTITTETSVDNWANNDVITIGSQTCIYLGGYTRSRYFDVDISAQVPATAFAVLLEIINREKSGVAANGQNCFGCHPFETYGDAKAMHHFACSAYEASTTFITLPVIGQKICVQLGAFGAVNASNTIALIRLRGYWE